MGFGDLATAAQMRDTIERIVKGVLKQERPEPFLAKVYDFNATSQKARVLPMGQKISDGLLTVRFGLDKIPRNGMSDNPTLLEDAPSDIVRVYGYSGSYFILDYFYGTPVVPGENQGAALHDDPSFDDTPWVGGFPRGWSNFWNSAEVTSFQEVNDVIHGRYALRITRPSGALARVHGIGSFAVTPGESITITEWARGSVTGGAMVDRV
jgi:hypothetical protein